MRLLLPGLAVGVLLLGVAAPAAAGGGHRPGALRLSAASVLEDAAPGTEVGVLTASDRDRGFHHTFALVPGTGDSGNGLFQIDGDRLEVAGPLDHETAPVLSVRVRVTDVRGLQRERSFHVAVADVNEAPTAISLSSDTVAEGSWGAVVGTLSATDPDLGDAQVFELVPGAGDTGNGWFEISGTTLKTAAILDYESHPTYDIRVRVTDAADATYEQVLTVHVTDVYEPAGRPNRAPTAVTIDHDTVTFPTPGASVVGVLSATDPDAGDTHTFTLVSAVSSFSVDVSTHVQVVGDQLQVQANPCGLFPGAYTVRVRAVDSGGLSVETELNVTVTNGVAPPRSPSVARAAC